MKRRKIFWASLVFSLSIHVSVLIFFITHFAWVDPTHFSIGEDFYHSSPGKDIVDIIFAAEEAASEIEPLMPQKQEQVLPKVVSFAYPIKLEEPKVAFSAIKEPPLEVIHPHSQCHARTFEDKSALEEWVRKLKKIPYHLKEDRTESLRELSHAQREILSSFLYQSRHFSPVKIEKDPASYASFFARIHDTLVYKIIKDHLIAKKDRPIRFLPLVPIIPTMEQLKTFSGSDDFDMDVRYIQDEKEYIFVLTVIPKPDHQFERIPQYCTFLFDRSNSIEHKRFGATRHALVSALHHIDQDFHFNIMAFDTRCDLLTASALPSDNESKKLAKSFLFSQELGSFLVSNNYMTPFNALLSQKVPYGAIHNVIFLTNGEDLHKMKNFRLLQNWTLNNHGNVSLFTIAKSEDKNRLLLEMFSNVNKGELVFSRTDRGIKRQLIKLLKTLSYPVAKNITVSAVSRNSQADLQIFHPMYGDLYMDRPLIIVGKTNSLEDFTLMIQGKNKSRWFNIKKRISLQKAPHGDESIEKRWAIIRSYHLYRQYLLDNNPQHLKEVHALLEPYGLESAL
ncbi:MAG: hypothetical protein JW769_04400 [Parachlamydiales bacterium]|nr:hypothetical protein [Parachlamydiales bacterium]